MSDIKEFIYNKMKEYSSISSTSGNEEEFCKFIIKDFDTLGLRKFSRRLVYQNDKLYYYFLQLDLSSKFFFTVHLDRVKNYTNTIKDFNEETIKGQLDDSISIAVLRYLLSKGYRFNVLFTTNEEICISWSQLQEIMTLFPRMKPISVDIDVVTERDLMNLGHISLRLGDSVGPYDTELVQNLRDLADSKNIPYMKEDVGWTAVEPAFLFRSCGLSGAHIGLPLINYHSDNEEMSWKTVESASNFIELFLQNKQEIK